MSAPGWHVGRWLGVALVAAVVVGVGLGAMGDWDLWWHLLTGRLAFETQSLLPVDVLSLTRAGEPWIYKDLGAELLLYGVYSAGGVPGLAILQLALTLCLAALLALRVARRVGAWWLTLLVTGGAFVVAAFRVVMRPDLFTLVLLAGLFVLLERWPAPDRSRRRGVAIAGLHLLWANLHRGVALGLCVVWARAGVAALARLLGRRPGGAEAGLGSHPALVPALISALAATGLSLLNPFGLTTLLQAFQVASGTALSEASVSEWESLAPAALAAEFPHAAVWMVVTAVAVPLAAFKRRREDPVGAAWDLVLTIAFLALGLRAARMLPLMAIATAGPLATALHSLLRASWRRVLDTWRPAPALAGLLVLALASTEPHVVWSRPGLMRDWYPEVAVAGMAALPIAGQGFTTFTFAGYLLFHLWPDQRVICDGRYDTVYDGETMATCFRAERDPAVLEALRQRYQLQWALAHNRPGPSRDPRHPQALDYLDVDPDWALVHWDAPSLLYVRRDGPNAALAAAHGYRFLRPHDPDVSLFEALQATRADPAQRAALDAEVWRLQEAAPRDYRVHILLVLYLHAIGETRGDAFRVAVEALRLDRDRDPAAIDRVLEWVGAESP